MGKWPHRCNNSHDRESASAYRQYDRYATGSSGH
jgi:hypothetical protein